MINKIKGGLKQRKVKIFLLSLACSFLAWFISNLSETYTVRNGFDFQYVNIPDTLLMVDASKENMDIKLKASGFQFLGFNYKNKKLKIDLTSVKKTGGKYFIAPNVYRKEIEKQLPQMIVLEMDQDTLFFHFDKLYSKTVPVKSRVQIQLGSNYLMEDKVQLKPSEITLTGLKEEIDTIRSIPTEKLIFPDITSNFSKKIRLEIPQGLSHTRFSATGVQVSGKVFRFSEKVIDVPVEVIHLPEKFEVKTFPEKIPVLCRAKIEQLKNLSANDFRVVADYGTVNGNNNVMKVQLVDKPKTVQRVFLKETQVEFILTRK